MDAKILTLHPQGKQGVNISQEKYDAMRNAILSALQEGGTMTFPELREVVERSLHGSFEGSIGWYFTTVKLDLEAHGEIERIPASKPQRLRLTEA